MIAPIYNEYVGQTFYTKRKHGSIPIHIVKEKERVSFKLEGSLYSSARSLFTHLYGKKTRISFSQYFPTIKDKKPSYNLAEEIYKVSTETKAVLGVDLFTRSHEVKKLFYAGFGSRCQASGYDPDDVLQEIYKGLIARNNGKCPFDPSKSSFGHYVHMVCGCIVANYHRKVNKIRQNEQVGIFEYKDGKLQNKDAALCATEIDTKTPELKIQESIAISSLEKYLTEIDSNLVVIMQCLREQMTRKEICERTGFSIKDVNTKVKQVRKITLKWAENL